MTRIRWWIGLLLLSVGVVGLDIVTGPYVLFPIAFVIPVCLAAWHLGRGPGIGFGVALVGCRLVIALTLESKLAPAWAAAINAGIRLLVLGGMALLVAKVARQEQALKGRLQILEGILPICSFCKKIRRPDGKWEQLEAYIGQRSGAKFSHGFCEECGRQHYGEFFPSSNQQGTKSGTAPGPDDK